MQTIFSTELFPTAPRRVDGVAIVAPGAATIHPAVQESAPVGSFTAIVQPDVPRLLQATFAAGWQGGDITVTGLDANGAKISEVLVSNPGGSTNGTRVFAVVLGIEKGAVAGTTDTVTIGTSGEANYYSGMWSVRRSDGTSIHIETSGTLTGAWSLWRTNKRLVSMTGPNLNDDTDWVEDTVPTITDPAGSPTKQIIELEQRSCIYRLKYVPASGAGSLFGWVQIER